MENNNRVKREIRRKERRVITNFYVISLIMNNDFVLKHAKQQNTAQREAVWEINLRRNDVLRSG